jgi:hypothetical protein
MSLFRPLVLIAILAGLAGPSLPATACTPYGDILSVVFDADGNERARVSAARGTLEVQRNGEWVPAETEHWVMEVRVVDTHLEVRQWDYEGTREVSITLAFDGTRIDAEDALAAVDVAAANAVR